jgi:hypothetical protein
VSTTRRARSNRALVAALALIGLHGALAWIAREPGVLTGQDDAEYILLAESLLDGGYNDLFRVDSPPHRTYPPVYPAALAAWGTFAGRGFDSLVALNVAVSAAALIVLFGALRRLTSDALALTTIALLAINPELIRFAGGVRSEPLFMLLTLVALAALVPADAARAASTGAAEAEPRVGRRSEATWLAIAIGAALLAALTRSVGVTVMAAIGLHWLLQKRWTLVAVPAGVATIAVAAWLAWTALGTDQFVGSSYMAELRVLWTGTDWTGPLPGRALRWSRLYLVQGLPTALALPAIPGTPVDNVVQLACFGAVGAVGLTVLLKRWRAAALWVIVYASFLAIWLFYVDRFVAPVAPLLVASVLIGAHTTGRRVGQRAGVALPAAAALILAVGATLMTASLLREHAGCDRAGRYPDPACMSEDQRSYFDALRWIDANTPADAVFLTAKPGALYVYTGRRSIAFDRSAREPEPTFIEFVRDAGAEWILLGSLHNQEPARLARRMKANCERLRVAAVFPPRTWLFRIEEGDTDAAGACDAIDAYAAANADNRLGETR